jgi:hypothetical protein
METAAMTYGNDADTENTSKGWAAQAGLYLIFWRRGLNIT